MARLFAGTSGFAYPSWKPNFYPAALPSKKFLEYYASRLNAVEVNYTFRRLPSAKTLENWANATKPDFIFAPKAHMRLTHILKLQNAAEFTELFLRSIDPLRTARRIGPILFQLAPKFACDVAVLEDYLKLLPGDLRFAFEFRHASWLQEPVYDALRKRNIAVCLAESEEFHVPEVITADFVYYRLRKPEYSPEDIGVIAARAKQLLDAGKDLYLFFKHEENPQGALYAEDLLARF
ncbi:MAG: DUF72 domain-containing protein [Acidobacteriota bacterium]|nr:DUF72 domain-containing protein [Acidobacteriota bacterium]